MPRGLRSPFGTLRRRSGDSIGRARRGSVAPPSLCHEQETYPCRPQKHSVDKPYAIGREPPGACEPRLIWASRELQPGHQQKNTPAYRG